MTHSPRSYRFCPRCGAPLAEGLKFGRMRSHCRYCHFIHFADPKVAVGALVSDGERVLLVRRGAVPRLGFWALPAGFMDSDELPEEAAAREITEETGVQARIGELRRVTTLGGWEERRGLLLLYWAEATEGTIQAGDDVTEAAWFAAGEIPWDELAFESTAEFLAEWLAERSAQDER
jgi:8-oxo-dGTP diphosphatase